MSYILTPQNSPSLRRGLLHLPDGSIDYKASGICPEEGFYTRWVICQSDADCVLCHGRPGHAGKIKVAILGRSSECGPPVGSRVLAKETVYGNFVVRDKITGEILYQTRPAPVAC